MGSFTAVGDPAPERLVKAAARLDELYAAHWPSGGEAVWSVEPHEDGAWHSHNLVRLPFSRSSQPLPRHLASLVFDLPSGAVRDKLVEAVSRFHRPLYWYRWTAELVFGGFARVSPIRDGVRAATSYAVKYALKSGGEWWVNELAAKRGVVLPPWYADGLSARVDGVVAARRAEVVRLPSGGDVRLPPSDRLG